jgi:8-oxo-dGTP pyrophosphatase MutT (NUDIX family)
MGTPIVSRYPREGFGLRHPEVAAFLAAGRPLHVEDARWPNGDAIRLTAFAAEGEVPDVVVSSVRCLVFVDPYVVVCHNAHDVRHAWPGGRREAGETFEDTACREVHEETGWLLDRSSLGQIGWLHVENLTPVAPSHPFPHPDAFQAVFAGRARSRAGDSSWTDTEGYELSSELVLATEARRFLARDPMSAFFLDRHLATSSPAA